MCHACWELTNNNVNISSLRRTGAGLVGTYMNVSMICKKITLIYEACLVRVIFNRDLPEIKNCRL